MSKPLPDVVIDDRLVYELLQEQHPDLARLPITGRSHGWDNEMVRIGPDLVVRLPRREVAAELIVSEQRWLPLIADLVAPLAVPAPVRIGQPGCGYPWSWSVCKWIEGTTTLQALSAGTFDTEHFIGSLITYLVNLHRPAPPNAPRNPYRGVPLVERDELTRARIHLFEGDLDAALASALWREGLRAAPHAGPPVWLHGDPHPMNLLVDASSQLCGVIDFGDIAAGDPASDLATLWMHLPEAAAESAFNRYVEHYTGDADALWERTRAWAVSLALAFIQGSEPGDELRSIAARTLSNLGALRP
jgi:aminoglycoside phosphotransferase (APT) family kinase protein